MTVGAWLIQRWGECVVGIVCVSASLSEAIAPGGEGFRTLEWLSTLVFGRTNGTIILPVIVGAMATVECGLGLRLLLGGTVFERRVTVALLAIFTTILIIKGSTRGWDVPCGCLDGILTMSTLGGVVRNIALVGALVACEKWSGPLGKQPDQSVSSPAGQSVVGSASELLFQVEAPEQVST